jgi:DNA-binding transcriptional LysR family regulator
MSLDNRISLQKLEIFCLVVDLGGVGRAAERLHVSQPVVTAHMRTLQERIGAQLLHRDGQRMRLTETGEAVYGWATEVLSRSHEVSRQIEGLADGRTGSVVVAASMSAGSYLLPPILSEFTTERPLGKIALHVCDNEDAQRATEAGDCDFAVTTSEPLTNGAALTVEQVGDHDLLLVASPDDTEVGELVAPDELGRLRFVCSPQGRPRRRLVDSAMRRAGIEERSIAIELGHPEALKTATRKGLGVVLLLRAAVEDELRAGTLREVKIEDTRLTVPVMLLRRVGKHFSPLQRELFDSVRACLAGGPERPSGRGPKRAR